MITERLRCILNYVSSEVIADIGTDHAYIPIELVKKNRVKRAIAADINEGPLKIAQKNIKSEGLSDRIETRLGSGISVLEKSEAGQIIIAGMGGELIEFIIKSDIEIAKGSELLLQPMNNQYELRKFLMYNGFKIIDEDIAVEGFKVYNIMRVVCGEAEKFGRDIDYHLPPYLKRNKFYPILYAKKEREFKKVIGGLERSAKPDAEKLEKYKEWYKELK